jgi:hypothetical protein
MNETKVQHVAEELARLSEEELEQLGDGMSKTHPEVIERLQNGTRQRKGKHSIMELKGLGKESWRSIDVDEYLRQERASWDR